MATAQQVIDLAQSQVGYHESYEGGHWTNHQKYSAEVPGLGWSDGYAWCATFVSWLFTKVGLTNFPVTASCASGVSYWKSRGRFSEYPAIGAQVFFGKGGGTHTGIVTGYDAQYVYTIEGNTNTSGSAEGDGVYVKRHLRADAYVYGYGYPEFEGGIQSADPAWNAAHGGAAGGVPSGSVSIPPAPSGKPIVYADHIAAATILDGDPSSPTGLVHYGGGTPEAVAAAKAVEQALKDKGYNPGPIDGSLGTMFRNAYRLWQRALGYRGVDADGIPGRASLIKLGEATGRFGVY